MVDLVLLRKKIKESGLKITAISNKSAISRETIYNRLNGKGEFTASEIVALTNVLGLTNKEREQIFFINELN